MGILRKIKDLMNNDRNNIKLLKKSDFFDEEYYLNENPNIKMSPVKHYYYYGFKEGKSPSYKFSNDYYLNTHKDVQASGMNPLVHYLRYGKAENRKIQKDFGNSIEGLYYNLFGYSYSINIYLTDENTNRINLFFDNIDKNIENQRKIIEYVVKYCNKYNYKLRIIYNKSDLSILDKFLTENNITIKTEIEYIYLKKDNYLFVGSNDKYVCTSYKCAMALLNSNIMNTNIYFYLSNNFYNYSLEEKYYISNLCSNSNIICLSESNTSVDKYQFEYEIINKLKGDELYYSADDFFLVGIIWLNRLISENHLNNYKFYISYKQKLNFHFDNEVEIKCEKNNYKFEDDVVFKISSNDYDNVNVIAKIKKIKSNIKIYDLNEFEVLNKKMNLNENNDEEYYRFKKIIEKIGE